MASGSTMGGVKELRYNVMLALYFPILLYSFSTFDLDDSTYAVSGLEPIVVGDQVVVLGQPFNAKAFLAVSGGQGQELQGDGNLTSMGDTLFQMQTGSLLGETEEEVVVPYNGIFKFEQVGGDVAEMAVAGSFKVKRPEIVASSEAMLALYRQSSNPIRIDVPGLEDRELELVIGSSKIKGRTAMLSPNGDNASVKVYLVDEENGNVFLGTKSFAVIEPPRPEISVTNAGRQIKSGDNLPKRRAVLEFSVDADQEFKRRYPKDARYRVQQATIYLRKGLTASKKIGTYDLDGTKLVLTRVLREAKPGDRVMVELSGVQRINHKGAAINVPLSETSRTFGFVIS